jgi:RNA polymerase sigma-70 factor, ECF subfamily
MGISTEYGVDVSAAATDKSSGGQEALYERISAEFAAPLTRLARAHEADLSLQQDLLQDIHIALWRSLPAFGGGCSLRTWVYRVAHNVAATHVLRRRRRVVKDLVNLDDIDIASEAPGIDTAVDEARMLARIRALVQRLKPPDREVFVLYLEGLSVEDIAEIASLSGTNTRTKLHRIRALLAAQLGTGENP